VLPRAAEPPDWLPQQTRIVSVEAVSSPMEEIRALDQSAALPYDFILTASIPSRLIQAARQLAIPVIALP
jgi:hypothetical protein